MRSLRSSGWRFLLVGGANTLLTGAALSVLSLWIDPRLAYTVVFALGLLANVALAGPVVYGVRMRAGHLVAYAGLYLLTYLIGLGVIALMQRAGWPSWTSGAVVLVTAPLTFLGGRRLAAHAHRGH